MQDTRTTNATRLTQTRGARLPPSLLLQAFGDGLELVERGSLESYELCAAELRKQSAETLSPPPLINGRDLIALGLSPGPRFKTILSEVEDRQLEGTLADKAGAPEYVRKLLESRPKSEPDSGEEGS